MLKNLSPLLSGALLSVLDEMDEGQTLTLAGADSPASTLSPRVIDLGDTSTEEAAGAILSVLPLDADRTPIYYLDAGGELTDTAYAVGGLARDAEMRRVEIVGMGAPAFLELARESVATVRVEAGSRPDAFLFRKGAC